MDIRDFSCNEKAVFNAIVASDHFSDSIANAVVHILRAMKISNSVGLLGEGIKSIIFDTSFDQIFKVTQHPVLYHPTHSNLILEPVYKASLGRHVSVSIFPRLLTQGVTQLHQDVLRYELWRRGLIFWDYLPALEGSGKMTHNVGLLPHNCGAFSGVPYIIDAEAVREDSSTEEYEYNNSGLRTPEAFRQMKASSWERLPREYVDRLLDHSLIWSSSQWDFFPRTILNDGHAIDWDAIQSWRKTIASEEVKELDALTSA